MNHECIEKGEYSTAKRYIQGKNVYSGKYNVGGKIDIYDGKTKTLIERKTRIKKIYDGHRLQMYAQMFALEEAGYPVEHLRIHSLEDNRRYTIPLPDTKEKEKFEETLKSIRSYNPANESVAEYKCDISIYRHLSY